MPPGPQEDGEAPSLKGSSFRLAPPQRKRAVPAGRSSPLPRVTAHWAPARLRGRCECGMFTVGGHSWLRGNATTVMF